MRRLLSASVFFFLPFFLFSFPFFFACLPFLLRLFILSRIFFSFPFLSSLLLFFLFSFLVFVSSPLICERRKKKSFDKRRGTTAAFNPVINGSKKNLPINGGEQQQRNCLNMILSGEMFPDTFLLCPVQTWGAVKDTKNSLRSGGSFFRLRKSYLMIFDTTPAPTVWPPSRIAKRRPCSIAIGQISWTVIVMLSPGITISTPSGSLMLPVTSVVRK